MKFSRAGKVIFFIIALIILDKVIGEMMEYFYFKQESGFQYRTIYAMNETTADVVVLGASTVTHHYVPDIFEDSLNMSFYNAGRDGSGIFQHYALMKAILKRYTPKVILLDLHPEALMTTPQDYDRLSELLPFYETHKEIRPVLELRSPYEKYKIFSSIYPYNSAILSIIMGNLEFNKTRKSDFKGYVPLSRVMENKKPHTIEYQNFSIDTVKVRILKEITAEAKAANTQLIAVRSPKYMFVDNRSTRLIKNILAENNILYLNYSVDQEFLKNPTYFSDESHLNKDGAALFSSIIVREIRNYLPQKNQTSQ